MDFFFDDRLPSTPQSTAKSLHEDSHMTEDAVHDSSKGEPSSASRTESQEQHARTASPLNVNCSSNIDDISRRVEDLVDKINDSRTSDQNVMDSFEEKMREKVTEVCQQMKEQMYRVYEKNSNEMQVKLQQLSKVLESCSKLNRELTEAIQALAGLREGPASSQMLKP